MKTKIIIVLAAVLLTMSEYFPVRSEAQQTENPIESDEGSGSIDCVGLARAHAALLNGCFSARREFRATINQKLALREVARLEYKAGVLNVEVIEKEQPNKRVEIGGQGDMAVEFVFACERLTRNTAGYYELESAEDPEQMIFDYDDKNDVLLPRRWVFEEKTRFLFKKFHIQAQADYSSVSYDNCGPNPGTSEEN